MPITAQSSPQTFINSDNSVSSTGYLFTFIIPYQHKMDRLMNLKRVIEWISSFKGVEIIIVEQDSVPRIKNISLKGTKYFFIKSDMPFNKSLCLNVGLKNSRTQAIVFGDADIIMDSNQFIQSLNLLGTYECVSPYNRVIDLEPQEVNAGLDNWKKITRPGRGETDIQKICLAGGIIMFRKDAAYKIAGGSEEFVGWGGEDDHLSFKIKSLLSWYEVPGSCFHLYHSKVVPNMTYYQRNLQILNQFVQMKPEDVQRQAAQNLPKIGMINKYDK